MLLDFNSQDLFMVGLIFVWTGFVRSGLGFGGAALGLPFMLFVYDQPLYWLPIIGAHLLFFSGLTLRTRLNSVDWSYLQHTLLFIIPAALVGIFGLLTLPNHWLLIFIYAITLFYAVLWAMNLELRSNNPWLDRLLLALGGYVAGTSLTGAPLMVAVFMRNVDGFRLRNTLFVLWFTLVSIKLAAFVTVGVDLHLMDALLLLPVAAIGHIIGLRTHDLILQNDQLFKRVIGLMLIVISAMGLIRQLF
jgi:uncharacterized membrane protein YfcA